MILVEGYTDVLALHQAGVRNAVGIMGTALTEEQVRSSNGSSHVLELCLDADRAGQDAMLRASGWPRAASSSCGWSRCPQGADPAELVAAARAPRRYGQLVAGRVPFVVFEVDRILERADLRSAEGRDRALDELRPLLTELPNEHPARRARPRVAGPPGPHRGTADDACRPRRVAGNRRRRRA